MGSPHSQPECKISGLFYAFPKVKPKVFFKFQHFGRFLSDIVNKGKTLVRELNMNSKSAHISLKLRASTFKPCSLKADDTHYPQTPSDDNDNDKCTYENLYKDKDKKSLKKNVLMYTGLNTLCKCT